MLRLELPGNRRPRGRPAKRFMGVVIEGLMSTDAKVVK